MLTVWSSLIIYNKILSLHKIMDNTNATRRLFAGQMLKQFRSIDWQCPFVCLSINIWVKVSGLSKISAVKSGTNSKLGQKVISNKFS